MMSRRNEDTKAQTRTASNRSFPMAQQQPPEKKLKPSPSTINKTQLLLQDYTIVRQTVRDILALVQTYGPLTAGQIEYNLPQVPSAIWGIPDILNILSSLEILHIAKDTNAYCWNGGIPRADVVLPTDVMSKIAAAIQEAEAAWQRGEILKEAVMKKMDHKQVLKKLLHDYPEIANDPVYVAAFKSSHIDLRGRVGKRAAPSSSAAASSASAGDSKPAAKSIPVPESDAAVTATGSSMPARPAAIHVVNEPTIIIPQPIKTASTISTNVAPAPNAAGQQNPP
jgi:hypothetical protein